MYRIAKDKVNDIAAALAEEHTLYAPALQRETLQVMFTQIKDLARINLTAALPLVPPKHVVFPQFGRTLSYAYDKAKQEVKFTPETDNSPKALFGVRACDLTGIQCLDRFYLGQDFVDEVYRDHRKKMFIVANTCVTPFRECFCSCMDSGPSAREGFDMNLTDLGNEYLIEIGSEKGETLAKKLSLASAPESAKRDREKAVDKSLSLFSKTAKDNKAWISRVVNRVTTGLFDEKAWTYIGDQCLECGACSFVCPSCSCFNVVDSVTGKDSAERTRTWDSCSFEGYSRMAGGHNPRKPVEDRRSKRFFCKLSYSQSKKYLRPGCVGCGRCAWVCPGDIGMPNVVTYIRREITKKGQ
ncbi:MAG: 4Fe-4S dicluster domain-containing protein [Spirochaetota bacterium]